MGGDEVAGLEHLMHLSDYVAGLPRGDRQLFRERLALAHECSVSLVRKWEGWPAPPEWTCEKVKAMARKHPAELDAIEITELMTNGKVTRYDLRPELWRRES